jgi:hypothetical protein
MGAIAADAADAPRCAAGARRTSVGEATGGHAGGAEGAGNGNHSDGVGGRSGDELGMNWGCNGWQVVEGGRRRRLFF